MKLIRKTGVTSQILQVFAQDSTSTTGAGKTGLAFGSMTAYFHRDIDTTATAITMATMTVGTWATGGWAEIDATNMPGCYQFCPPNTAFASAAKATILLLRATGMAPLAIEVQLIAADVDDTVRLGLTALPNAAAEAAGGLYTRGTGAGQIAQDANGNVRVNVDTIKTNPVVNAGTITFPTTATLASTTNITAGTITTVTTTTTATNLTNAPTAGDFTAVMKTSIGTAVAASAVASVTGSVGSVAAGGLTGIANRILDEPITAATHTTTDSVGKRLRDLSGQVITQGIAQTGSTATTIVLAAAASATNGLYDPSIVQIVAGTGAGQTRFILQYDGTTKVAAIDRDWRTTPDTTSEYVIYPAWQAISTNEGLATGGGASTITLNGNASAIDSTYVGQLIQLRTGTGQDQSRMISAYVGSTKVATVSSAWTTNPAAGTGYVIWPVQVGSAGGGTDPWLTAVPGAYGAGTAGKILGDNLNATVSSRMATFTYTAPLDAAGTRTAVGLASANLDTQLATLPTAAGNATALLDLANGIETSLTPRQAFRLMTAALAGKLSGAATTSIVIRNVGDTKARITATVDASGNRTSVTTDGT